MVVSFVSFILLTCQSKQKNEKSIKKIFLPLNEQDNITFILELIDFINRPFELNCILTD
jgi:hypothetical protein